MGRTTEELFNEAKNRVLSETKISNLRPGSIARAILQNHTSQLGELYQYIDQRMLQAYVSTATGTALDQIGQLVGAQRDQSRFGQGVARLYINPDLSVTFQDILDMVNNRTGGTATTITLPAGTTVKAGNKSFVTETDAVLTANAVSTTTNILSSLAGSFGNTDAGTLDTIQWPDPALSVLQGVLLVTNDEAVESGKDIQSDEDFRFIIVNSFLFGVKANETAIRIAALSVPGVSDVTIQNYAYGIGTFAVFVTASSPIVTLGTLQAVQAAINSAQAKGIRGVAVSPDLIGVKIKVALTFLPTTRSGEMNAINTGVQNAIVDYINNLKTGDDLVVNEVLQRVMDVSTFIHDSEIVTMAIGTYNVSTGLVDNLDQTISVTNQTSGPREKFVTNTVLAEVCHI